MNALRLIAAAAARLFPTQPKPEQCKASITWRGHGR